MSSTLVDSFRKMDFFEIRDTLRDESYTDVLFPFLLIYALIYTALTKIKLFQNKSGNPNKPVITIISLTFSWFATAYEISPGYSMGKLLSLMFPNISALTIGILTLYIVGAMLNKNFFKNLVRFNGD